MARGRCSRLSRGECPARRPCQGAQRPAKHTGKEPGMTRRIQGESPQKRRGGALPPRWRNASGCRCSCRVLLARLHVKGYKVKRTGQAITRRSAMLPMIRGSNEMDRSREEKCREGAAKDKEPPAHCWPASLRWRANMPPRQKTAKGGVPRRQIGCGRFPSEPPGSRSRRIFSRARALDAWSLHAWP